MRDRSAHASAGALVTFVSLTLLSLGCEVGRVPELARDASLAGEGGVGGSGDGGGMTGGQSGASGASGMDGQGPCENGGGCSPLVECTVEDGEAVCGECPIGTRDEAGDGARCVDVDECAMNTDDCDRDPEATLFGQIFRFDKWIVCRS
jgi:hypothetical protein